MKRDDFRSSPEVMVGLAVTVASRFILWHQAGVGVGEAREGNGSSKKMFSINFDGYDDFLADTVRIRNSSLGTTHGMAVGVLQGQEYSNPQ
jgi:hypothetical protein